MDMYSLHHSVILKSQNKITDFFMILAWVWASKVFALYVWEAVRQVIFYLPSKIITMTTNWFSENTYLDRSEESELKLPFCPKSMTVWLSRRVVWPHCDRLWYGFDWEQIRAEKTDRHGGLTALMIWPLGESLLYILKVLNHIIIQLMLGILCLFVVAFRLVVRLTFSKPFHVPHPAYCP